MWLTRPAFWCLPKPRFTLCLGGCGPKLDLSFRGRRRSLSRMEMLATAIGPVDLCPSRIDRRKPEASQSVVDASSEAMRRSESSWVQKFGRACTLHEQRAENS